MEARVIEREERPIKARAASEVEDGASGVEAAICDLVNEIELAHRNVEEAEHRLACVLRPTAEAQAKAEPVPERGECELAGAIRRAAADLMVARQRLGGLLYRIDL